MSRADVISVVGPPFLIQKSAGFDSMIYHVDPESAEVQSSEVEWVGFEVFLEAERVVLIKDTMGRRIDR
jgi:hypothetical protein